MTADYYAYGFEMLDYDVGTGRAEREPVDLAEPEQERFAIAECPSIAAGVPLLDDDDAMQVAGEYDGKAQARDEDGEHPNGVIAEDDARAAWIEAIDELRSRGETDAADRGRAIAIALGWLDDEQEQEQ